MQDQWQSVSVGGKGYAGLWGGQPVMRADNDPPVPIQVTAEGRKWLGPGFSATSRTATGQRESSTASRPG